MQLKKGKVYLVGAGPGDAELITIKGLKVLENCDVVIYDHLLIGSELLSLVNPKAEKICADKMDKRYPDGFIHDQEKINILLVKEAKKNKIVCRLKNGDPFIFGRGGQEAEYLVKHKIPFEIIPGVSAAQGASCYTGIPLTDRRFASTVTLITGHEDPAKKESAIDWQNLPKKGTLVFYMAVENLERITKKLISSGHNLNQPAALVEWATFAKQRVTIGSLSNISQKAKRQDFRPPCILLVGEVVSLRKNLDWFNKKKRVLYTGVSLEKFLEDKIVFHQPMIRILPVRDFKELDCYINKISGFHWLIFTSRFAVRYFLGRLFELGEDSRILKDVNIAAIGETTASFLRDFGIVVDLISTEETTEGLIREFGKIDLKDKKVLHPCSPLSPPTLKDALTKCGAEVVSVITYRNVKPKAEKIDLNLIDEIYFLSPSGFNNFLDIYKQIPKRIKIKAIGKPTRDYIRSKGYKAVIFIIYDLSFVKINFKWQI